MTVPLNAKQLVDRLWSYRHVLRHDGVSTIDYVDQLTLLLFLKMADERAQRPLNPERIVPAGLDRRRCCTLKATTSNFSTTTSCVNWPGAGHARAHFPEVAEQDSQRATLRKLIVD